MTDNDIIKALECCYSLNLQKCKMKCPLRDKPLCSEWLSKYALDLINRQKAEIERLQGWQDLLNAEKHSLIKAEAIKDFAKRLKYKFPDGLGAFNSFDVMEIVDDLVKEMVGDSDV